MNFARIISGVSPASRMAFKLSECQEARDSTAWCPGLNGRECHGSFSDKGDFQLSLFGYEFDKDHEEIVRDEDEIRVNRDQPENSLILV